MLTLAILHVSCKIKQKLLDYQKVGCVTLNEIEKLNTILLGNVVSLKFIN